MSIKVSPSTLVNWVLTLVFLILGIMNFILVHPVPGTFYILFSFVFPPPVNSYLKKKTGFSIPLWLKFFLAFLILWGTLAVGDLAEMYGL